jgi:outer membrane biosynthesis protein TonB
LLPGRARVLVAVRAGRSVTAIPTPGASPRRDTVWPIFLALSVLLHVWLFLSSRPAFPELGAGPARAGITTRIVVARLAHNLALPTPAAANAAAPSPPAATPAAGAQVRTLPTVSAPLPQAVSVPDSAAPDAPGTAQAEGAADPNLYYSAHALSRQPELVGESPDSMEIPDGVQSGHLLVRLSIDRFGKVNAVSVLRSTLPHDIEGQVVMQFYQARYRPGEINGKPVNGEMILFINLERT